MKAVSIIKSNNYLTMAVSNNRGEPWIANVYYAVDNNCNFYWYSSKQTRHSKILKQNNMVAFSIFNSTVVGDDVDAVYGSAVVSEVTNVKELTNSLKCYAKKMEETGFVDSKAQIKRFMSKYHDFKGISELRLYKATPVEIYKLAPSRLFNEKYIDSRIELDIHQIREVLNT